MNEDIYPRRKRSEIMSKVKSKDTALELIVRSQLHRAGFRFRLHVRELPGMPDIVLPKYKTAIFVHGCFWHQHSGCKKATIPKQNRDFWSAKLARNVERDEQARTRLSEMGWRVLTIWECEIKPSKLPNTIARLIEKLRETWERA